MALIEAVAAELTKYTQLQKKPISHFSGQIWKTLRNEEMKTYLYHIP